VNESPNNTGKKQLPPATPAFVWYPYAKADDFPMAKEGGRNAMAGPVYYSENFKGTATAFPDYFDGKLLIYDWMRNWMFMVSMDSTGAIADMEPFMPNTKFNNIMDLSYGPDGKLYMLEYGTAWFKQNLDARLVRIDYNGGNRPPVATLAADKYNGALPLTVAFSTKGTYDPDGDDLKFELTADGKKYTSDDGNFSVTFKKAGVFNPEFTVTDSKENKSSAKLQVTAGNEPPVVTAAITSANKTFYFPATPVTYEVQVNDKEDGTTKDGAIKPDAVKVTFDYLKGFDMTGIAMGHQRATAELPGKTAIDKSDCKSCHLIDQKSAGPAYKDVAARYKGKQGAIDQLAAKIIKGGAGVWGTTEMSAHPQISVDDARLMVEYILSLGEEKKTMMLPLSGSVKPDMEGKDGEGAWLLTATYFDRGANNVPSIPGSTTVVLRNPWLKADQATDLQGVSVIRQDNNIGLENVRHNTSAAFKEIDLTGVKSLGVMSFMIPDRNIGGDVEIHLDKPDGELLSRATVTKPGMASQELRINAVDGIHTLYLRFVNPNAGDKTLYYFLGLKLANK
jgi:cytochrome c